MSAVELLATRFVEYRRTLQPDRRHLLEGYRIVDMARKVVGVGSVGTRTWILLMLGKDDNDPLMLQIKEATPSVLEEYAGRSGYASTGNAWWKGNDSSKRRATSSWAGSSQGVDSVDRDYYVRQLWDGKMSRGFETMTPRRCASSPSCAGGRWPEPTHVRATASQSPPISARARRSTAPSRTSATYADLNDRDYEAVTAAVKGRGDGRLACERPSRPRGPA